MQDHEPDSDTDAEAAGDDAACHPCVQGLIAANVALMTAWANPAPSACVDCDTQRCLLARKVVSNLFCLRQHPLLSPALRQVMAKAHEHWQEVAQRQAGPASALRH